ncbi:cold-shock protein [Nocardia sp. NPDC057440]|uniref:cold-shock protein n=1 Tax=Nocardia sp. NPDC057440 TaxID=3346134 RepID=UPI003672686A
MTSQGTIWRWNPAKGTGVIKLPDETLVWFHLSAFDNAEFNDIAEGVPVDVDIDHTPQGEFLCRASRIQLSLPVSWQS